MLDTSWEKSGKWYKNIVGDEGHYYHQKIILPHTLRLLKLQKGDSLLDLACGQGVLERQIPDDVDRVFLQHRCRHHVHRFSVATAAGSDQKDFGSCVSVRSGSVGRPGRFWRDSDRCQFCF